MWLKCHCVQFTDVETKSSERQSNSPKITELSTQGVQVGTQQLILNDWKNGWMVRWVCRWVDEWGGWVSAKIDSKSVVDPGLPDSSVFFPCEHKRAPTFSTQSRHRAGPSHCQTLPQTHSSSRAYLFQPVSIATRLGVWFSHRQGWTIRVRTRDSPPSLTARMGWWAEVLGGGFGWDSGLLGPTWLARGSPSPGHKGAASPRICLPQAGRAGSRGCCWVSKFH